MRVTCACNVLLEASMYHGCVMTADAAFGRLITIDK